MVSRVHHTAPSIPKQKPAASNAAASKVPAEVKAQMKYGHLTYAEVPKTERSQLKSIGAGFVLKPEAADAFLAMTAAAKKAGITLKPAYGFRDLDTQKALFNYNLKMTEAQRAKLRAPPGHSEHHTGYALDINSVGEKMTEKSKAYTWLKAHAAEYGFENSFGKGNTQGVAFEPWHWRYVGNTESQQVFTTARTVFPATIEAAPRPAGWAPAQ